MYSIIIPTHNRAVVLKQNLEVISQIKYDSSQFEIIVVDDGSADNIKEIVLSYAKVKYRRIEHQGAPAARNSGAELSNGSILVFIDDDCFPAPDYLTQQDVFWGNPANVNLGILGGAIEGVSNTFFGKICDYFDSYGITDGPVTKASTSNFSIRKELFLQCEGFNPSLQGAEDVDLSIRVKKTGHRVHYSSKIKIFHHHTKRTFRSLIKRAWSWALNGEIHLALKYTNQLCPPVKSFDKFYNAFIKNLKLKKRLFHLFLYPFIGMIHCFISTYRLHSNNAKQHGFKIHYFPFTFLINLTYEAAFLYYLLCHGRRYFWYFRNKYSKNIFSPLSLLFSVTSACNYRCDHCFYYKKLNSTKDLPFPELLKIIRKFEKIDELSLTGGEPFLRKDLIEILEAFYLKCHPSEINIPTNAWHQDRIVAVTEELLERSPLCNINIFLSFHGLEKIHDAITHVQGSFLKAVETGKSLRRRFNACPRFYLSSLVCVHSENIDDIEAWNEKY